MISSVLILRSEQHMPQFKFVDIILRTLLPNITSVSFNNYMKSKESQNQVSKLRVSIV